jgi:hypothetical protein
VKPLHPISIDSSAVEQSAIRKIAMRLVPFIALMFFINYLDRTAISFAGPNGVAEAGFFPGAILFLSMWVPAEDRSKIFSLFYLAQPLRFLGAIGRFTSRSTWNFRPRRLAIHVYGCCDPCDRGGDHRVVLPVGPPGRRQVAFPGGKDLADGKAKPRARRSVNMPASAWCLPTVGSGRWR